MKQLKLATATRLDLFFEAYNLFNSANYENPTGNMSSANFAIRTVARDARQIQWGARFSF